MTLTACLTLGLFLGISGTSGAGGTGGAGGAGPAAGSGHAAGNQRQQQFTAAAREFGVPVRVLLGVSFLQSRWDTHGGRPSTSGGYGPMHLTGLAGRHDPGRATRAHHGAEEDPRGDTARSAVRPRARPAADTPPRTLDRAARLLGSSPDTLRTDPAQNIRGGAALLAEYQRAIAAHSSDPADWYAAVARYSGAGTEAAARAFADEVYSVIKRGQARTTNDGQRMRLPARADVDPRRSQLDQLDLRGSRTGRAECPAGLPCEWLPAPYQRLADGGYGNHDLADRPGSQDVDYIIIHDTETSWENTLDLVQNPEYVSWHYTLRSRDGHIAQHVPTEDVAWQAGNWYVNAKSIGLEHEGYAKQGTWYTEAMYRTSARLVRYLAGRYDIPLDRQHILGHDNVPGTIPETVAGMHADPGPYWDWAHYFDLLGAPIHPTAGPHGGMVTVKPRFEANRPAFTGCDPDHPDRPCPERGASSVVLRTQPRADAPLLTDIGLHPDGSPSTMNVLDIGSRMATGQQYAVAERRGDWTAVWYLGQKGWFHNPRSAPTAMDARGPVVTPKPGTDDVPVYGRAYPEASAYPDGREPEKIVPLQYRMPAGQRYTLGMPADTEYYAATTFDADEHVVVRGKTRYYQVQFGHRIAYVKAEDVRVVPSRTP